MTGPCHAFWCLECGPGQGFQGLETDRSGAYLWLMLLACPQCLTANRVPSERLADEPKCGKCGSPVLDGKPKNLDAAAFDAFLSRNELPVLVDFWAAWCGPCRAMAPAFERTAADMKTRVRFAKLDTEQAQAVAARYAIRSIPTMILFRGGREAARVSGAMDARGIQAWLAPHLVTA